MKPSHALALSGLAVFLMSPSDASAQVIRAGQQCVPAVTNPAIYHNCRLQIVRGNEVCRCAISPQALRQRWDQPNERGELTTGAIRSRSTAGSIGPAGEVGNAGASGTVGSVGTGRAEGVGAGSNVGTGGTIGNNGSVADNRGGKGSTGKSGGGKRNGRIR